MRIKISTYMTAGIAAAVESNEDFRQFIKGCFLRHLRGDWGNITAEDAELNNMDPRLAMSVYTSPDGRKVWLKQDFDILTVLFPSEY